MSSTRSTESRAILANTPKMALEGYLPIAQGAEAQQRTPTLSPDRRDRPGGSPDNSSVADHQAHIWSHGGVPHSMKGAFPAATFKDVSLLLSNGNRLSCALLTRSNIGLLLGRGTIS
jgi:hypothetical protein